MHYLESKKISYTMEKLSEIISKKVVALAEGEEVGYILSPVFYSDGSELLGFVLCDGESEIEKFLSVQDVVSCSDEHVFIKSISAMQNLEIEQLSNPLGKLVYDENGVNLGRVEECELEKNKIKKLQTDKCEIMQKNIECIGKDFVIYKKNKKNSKKSEKNNKKSFNFSKISPKVEILNQNNLQNQQFNFSSSLPIKATANKSKLLGKTLTKSLFGYNNEIIGKKDEKITEKIIARAIKHNKMNFLFFFSK